MARDERAAFGVEGDWAVARRHAGRWAECDAYGHVNHAAYLTMCEDLRVGHWSALGGRVAPDHPGPVVAQLEARYLRPLGFEDEVLLTLRPAAVRRTSFTHEYAVWKGGLVFECRAVLVAVRQDNGARMPIPPEIRARMVGQGARDEAGAAG